MIISSPCAIAPNLEPGIRIGDSWVTIGYSHRPGRESRTRFRCTILFGDGDEYVDHNLQSGNGGCGSSLQAGLESFLCFLGAAAESLAHCERMQREPDEDDNANLFPPDVTAWARQWSNEIAMAQCELNETPSLIVE